jgi:hypothetical protein
MGLFDSAVGLLTGQSSATAEGPTSATSGPVTVTPTSGGGPQSINFGGENTNWIIIAAVVAVVFLLSRK